VSLFVNLITFVYIYFSDINKRIKEIENKSIVEDAYVHKTAILVWHKMLLRPGDFFIYKCCLKLKVVEIVHTVPYN